MNISKHSLSPLQLTTPFSKWLLFLLTFFISNYCYSGIYKWVDDQGSVHYGQQRPTHTQAERMSVENYAPADTSSYKRPGSKADGEENNAQPASDKTDDTEETKKKPESKADKKRRLAACAQAKKGLATMQSSGRVRNKEKDGSINYLSEKQKAAKVKQSRDLISKHCSK